MDRPGNATEVEHLIDEATLLIQRGDPEGALARAEAAFARSPGFAPALHARAAALAQLGRFDEARLDYEVALSRGDDDLGLISDAADFFVNRLPGHFGDRRRSLERGLALARRGQKLALRAKDELGVADFALQQGMALSQLGEPKAALQMLDVALSACPGDCDAMLERGFALYDLCRFDEAREQFLEVVRACDDSGWAHQVLGLIAERKGDVRQAERRFALARRLSPDEFPRPIELSPGEFDSAIEDALAALPEQLRFYFSNVAIAVEDLPLEEDLLAADPPFPPSILGMFRGAPLGAKASPDPWNHFPSSIVLYQKNLERVATDRQELIKQIGVTLIHEMGHFLGLDDDDLCERGLE